MSFKDIKELRQAGKLEEALQMASQALEAEPENIWNKRAAAWVYYDFLKNYSKAETYDSFKEKLIKAKELQLPVDEKMFFDNCAWQIGSLVFELQKQDQVDYSKINELFEIIKDFYFSTPSDAFSFIYKAFHKGYQNWSRYLEFADWWNFENFRPADFLKEEFNDKKIMSIAEQAYIAYSKKLLKGETMESQGFILPKSIDKEKIKAFLPKLDKLIDSHPEYQYPPYFKAKLLLAQGEKDNILSVFLPFAKMKKNDFWVWELMADVVKEESVKIACLAKALSLPSPEKFTINTRQKLAEVLVKNKEFDEAKTEILKIDNERTANGWKLPETIKNWQNQPWYEKAKSFKDNNVFYNNHLQVAEELLFIDIPEEIVAVEFVNKDKGILNYVQDKQNYGFFKYRGLIDNPGLGNLLKVRFQSKSVVSISKVYTVKTTNDDAVSQAVKDFAGIVRINHQNKFGFVDDVYLAPDIVTHYNIEDNQNINGRAIMSYNKKNNAWGWKAIKLNT